MLTLSTFSGPLVGTVGLPASKSECNRALIIQALAGSKISLANISEARDSQTLQRLLNSNDELLNVLDAGTTMRFLTAYCAVSGKQRTLTGTDRMKQRPIGPLVNALSTLGAKIDYLEQEGSPPITTRGFEQLTNKVSIRGNISSQFITALLLVAPYLPQGLSLMLEGEVHSRPYIDMTLRLMQRFGAKMTDTGSAIHVEPSAYKQGSYTIEADWSAASYWYTFLALADAGELTLPALRQNSLQGDSKVADLMQNFGVTTNYTATGIQLQKVKPAADVFEYDFTHQPDLAQTFAVLSAATGTEAKLTGLQSLRIKETDRIAALKAELAKFGVETAAAEAALFIPKGQQLKQPSVPIATYHDHRMAMAFAPLAIKTTLTFEAPEVVNKSYPTFWEELQKIGLGVLNHV
jgi:3-phosphoshikimate 1-carboxyvinyltransferase